MAGKREFGPRKVEESERLFTSIFDRIVVAGLFTLDGSDGNDALFCEFVSLVISRSSVWKDCRVCVPLQRSSLVLQQARSSSLTSTEQQDDSSSSQQAVLLSSQQAASLSSQQAVSVQLSPSGQGFSLAQSDRTPGS